MADLTITGVGLAADAAIKKVQIGEAATVGTALYLDTASGTWKKADANNTETTAGKDGVAILLTEAGAANQYGVICTSGTMYVIAGVVKGTTYVVSATAGGIAPDTDAVSGWYKTVLGVGGDINIATNSFDEIVVNPVISGKAIT